MSPKLEVIDRFEGEWEIFSNFYPSSVESTGFIFPTVEHAYVASKCNDHMFWRMIAMLPAEDAGKAKKLGRKVYLRKDWDIIKISVMKRFLEQKFRIPELRDKLLSTGDATLIEGNYWHDNYWGDCSCKKCEGIQGANHLGKLLMERREIIKRENSDNRRSA
jgi:ribA/ribD-fused uncharacterized protein